MIMKTTPSRLRLLPVASIVLVTLFVYLYLFNRPALSHPLWASSTEPLPSTSSSTSPSTPYDIPYSTPSSSVTAALSGKPLHEDSAPKPGEVVMVTASSGTGGFLGIPGLKEMVYENRMTYAHNWGYEHMWANITSYDFGEKIYWNKIPILQEAFVRYPKAKWIWWLDIDIIFMNMSLDIHTHLLSREGMMRNLEFDKVINKVGGGPSGYKTPAVMDPDNVNFLIASGGWGMNVGNFLMRRSQWSDWLLEMWADPLATAQGWILPENDGWTHMWRNHQIVRDHTGCTNQNALNPYPAYNPLGSHWKEGDLVIHFAGCGNSTMCPREWKKYWDQREKMEVPSFVKEKLANGTAEIENIQKGVGL